MATVSVLKPKKETTKRGSALVGTWMSNTPNSLLAAPWAVPTKVRVAPGKISLPEGVLPKILPLMLWAERAQGKREMSRRRKRMAVKVSESFDLLY